MLSGRAADDTQYGRDDQCQRLPRAGTHGCAAIIAAMLGACPDAVNMTAMLGAQSGATTGRRPLASNSVSAPAVASGGAQVATRSHDD